MHETIRLHISPLTPAILPKILSQQLIDVATNISYHELQAFPERNYGFVDLPVMEAQKLKKKVNGSIIKGAKIKVEEARGKKITSEITTEDQMDVQEDKPVKAAKKRKREEGTLPGHELPAGRQVKRGWTEPIASKIKEKRERKSRDSKEKSLSKKQQPSQHTDKAECLFKTKVPPNKEALGKSGSKEKKKGGKGKTPGEVVVHEFEHNEKHPSFIRSTINKDKMPVASYDDEKGWIDGEGKTVEPARTRSKRKPAKADSPSNQLSAERLGSLSLQEQEDADADATSSSGSSSSAESAEDSEASISPKYSASPAPHVSIEKEKSATPSQTATHPLETLYKKPSAPASETSNRKSLTIDPPPFSFFGADGDADDEQSSGIAPGIKTAVGLGPGTGDTGSTLASPPSAKPKRGAAAHLPSLAIPPHTPFTQRDLSWRSQRSAAPTPDTALPGKGGFANAWGRSKHGQRLGDEDEIEEEGEEESGVQGDESSEGEGPSAEDNPGEHEDDGSPAPKGKPGKSNGQQEESEFIKEFYAHRGERNRQWKRARREANKAHRKVSSRRTNN